MTSRNPALPEVLHLGQLQMEPSQPMKDESDLNLVYTVLPRGIWRGPGGTLNIDIPFADAFLASSNNLQAVIDYQETNGLILPVLGTLFTHDSVSKELLLRAKQNPHGHTVH